MEWRLNQQNRITFVMVDGTNTEVAGLGGTFTLEISKNGGAFTGSAGVKAEISDGWYTYLATAAEADTVGVVSIRVTGAGAVQQNLEYEVKQRTPIAVVWPYVVTNTASGLPEDGVEVHFATDTGFLNIVWVGVSDALGVTRDTNSEQPYLDPGTYYVRKQKSGFIDDDAPYDTEVVS